MSFRSLAFALAAAALAACSEKPSPGLVALVPEPAAVAVAAASPPETGAPAPGPAAPASILPLVRAAAAVEPAGPAPLAHDGEAVVDPGASFEIELGAVVPDVRLVLLDAQDAHVAAESARELGRTTRLTLVPAAPLSPGSRYVLRLEGLAARDLRDADDRAYAPQAFALLVAGTPPPPEPKEQIGRAHV